jgi:hypothetical protein
MSGLADQDRPVTDGAHQAVVFGAVAFQRNPAQFPNGRDALSEQVGSFVEPCRAKHVVVQAFDGASQHGRFRFDQILGFDEFHRW